MSYWRDAEDFCRYNKNYYKSRNTTVRSKGNEQGLWFNVRSGGVGGYFGKRLDVVNTFFQPYFQDWDNQTQKEWDMVCMLFNIPQIYVKQ